MKQVYIQTKIIVVVFCMALASLVHGQTGNHVFSGGEAVNFDTIHLATPGGQSWSTDRTATPGYFSCFYPAAFLNGASDAANINGYVKKYGNQAFSFPVGTGSDLRTLAMSAPTSATDIYAAAWILGNPTTTADPTNANALHDTAAVTAPIKRVMPIGQWDWQSISGSGAGLTITASMPNLSGFAPKGHLRLVGWQNSTGKWIDLSAAANATGNVENSTISGIMQAGIDAISIGSKENGFPDLTPSSRIANANFTAASTTVRDLVVDVNEILASATDNTLPTSIRVRVSKSPNFTYTFNPATTSVNAPLPTPVQNSLWTVVSNTASAITLQLTPGNEIAALSRLSFSLNMVVLSGAAPSTLNVNISIFDNSGGEIVVTNNQVSRIVNIQ